MEYLRWHSNISLISLKQSLLKVFLNQKSVFLDVLDSLYSLEFSFSWSFIFGHKSSKFSVTFHIIVLTRARWSTLFFYSLANINSLLCVMVKPPSRQLIFIQQTCNQLQWRYSDLCLDKSCVTHVSLQSQCCHINCDGDTRSQMISEIFKVQ